MKQIRTMIKRIMPTLIVFSMILTIIFPAGSAKAFSVTEFSDVDPDSSIAQPVYWGTSSYIINGFDDGTFRPEDSCTRQQFVIMLWRLMHKPSASRVVNFRDVTTSTSGYKAIQWATEKGIIAGFEDGTFRPEDTVTRQQACIMLWRLTDKPRVSSSSKFSDVNETIPGYAAICWGSSAGIVKGYEDGTFRPREICQRQHIVIFLYRYARDILMDEVKALIPGKGLRQDTTFDTDNDPTEGKSVSKTRYSYEIIPITPTEEEEYWQWGSIMVYVKTDNPDPATMRFSGISLSVAYQNDEKTLDKLHKAFGLNVISSERTMFGEGMTALKVQGGYVFKSTLCTGDSGPEKSGICTLKVYETSDMDTSKAGLDREWTLGASKSIKFHGFDECKERFEAYCKELAEEVFGPKYEFSWEKLENFCSTYDCIYPYVKDGSLSTVSMAYYSISTLSGLPWDEPHVIDSTEMRVLLVNMLSHCPGVTTENSAYKWGYGFHSAVDVTYNGETRDRIGLSGVIKYVNIAAPDYVAPDDPIAPYVD